MVSLNFPKREMNVKIVYYGPALSGKTTNLETIHKTLPDTRRGQLLSLATQTDRTLFFDLLPLEFGEIEGFATRFHLYTVPGQVMYNTTRKKVLTGADGVVFVADSQPHMARENLQSLENLAENLASMGRNIADIPLVLQYNKRDMPNAMTVEDMNAALNPRGLPWFESVANRGDGVVTTLT
ncbi:MAG: hypothetical protein K8I02_08975, partial [Candidatus Methylomirabilis sp.]|nr:hypothetical protein [Deltaproteobacteria bacterium]